MREADIDGFRLDAVKHMGELAIARFCSEIREYAYRLGKRWFLLYGELVEGNNTINHYIEWVKKCSLLTIRLRSQRAKILSSLMETYTKLEIV